MWIPGRPSGMPTAPSCDRDLVELLRGEPARRVRADRVERDVAEVEQARVADDHVEADRHRREAIITTIESVFGTKSPITGSDRSESTIRG